MVNFKLFSLQCSDAFLLLHGVRQLYTFINIALNIYIGDYEALYLQLIWHLI